MESWITAVHQKADAHQTLISVTWITGVGQEPTFRLFPQTGVITGNLFSAATGA